MKKEIISIMIMAGITTAVQAQCGDSIMYSPDPNDPNFNPLHPDADYDNDGLANSDDPDDDNDGVPDGCDHSLTTPPTQPGQVQPLWWTCPPWLACFTGGSGGGQFILCTGMAPTCDTDGDGIPNNQDDDDDGDGVPDVNDPDHPAYNPSLPGSDPDCDGQPNSQDLDDDGDGCPDAIDPNPCDPSIDCSPDPGTGQPPGTPGGPGDPGDDPPPNRPDPPLPPDNPIIPDPPDDPIPPDPPQPPVPPVDPNCPCCPAITERLDILITFARDQADIGRTTNLHLIGVNSRLDSLYNGLIQDDFSVFKTLNSAVYDVNAYLGSMHSIMSADLEYQFDQTWYLQQLYNLAYLDDNPNDHDWGGIGDLEEYTPTSATSAIVGLKVKTEANMAEHGQNFSLPNITQYADDQAAPVFALNMSFVQDLGIFMPDIRVDFSPYIVIRGMVHLALITLTSLNGIFIVWAELAKR